MPPEPTELRAQLAEIADGLREALEDLRELSRGIHPAILSEGGLSPALKALARRSAVPVELDIDIKERLPEPIEVAAYFVASEALANTAKHARASVAQVEVRPHDGRLHLSIRDDGVGGAMAGGSGLVGLTDRVEALGGTILIDSPPGQGTKWKCTANHLVERTSGIRGTAEASVAGAPRALSVTEATSLAVARARAASRFCSRW